MSFAVRAVTGFLAFVRPFSIGVVGLHAGGGVFVGLITLHVANNLNHLLDCVDERIGSALGLIDSALLTIGRN